MCLAIPGKIVEIYEESGLLMGKLDFGGTVRKCCLQCIPEALVGDYALVHVGFAISLVDEAEAARTYQLLAEMGELMAQIDAEAAETPESSGAQP
ncbi:MAG TPA: HypC/HybG/HupF family hydrogenase formation chaperone [Candidatus Tectomicrobia bacterium]